MRKTRLRHGLRELRRRLEAKDAPGAAELVPGTFSIVDRAAKWGIIRKNTAARYKSRITARLRALTPATA
jgi:small subunit ribosomal protein S20